jgi:hypothetical protein
VSGIVWNILITALTTAAFTTTLNTGLYQVSFCTRKRKNQVNWLEMVNFKDFGWFLQFSLLSFKTSLVCN